MHSVIKQEGQSLKQTGIRPSIYKEMCKNNGVLFRVMTTQILMAHLLRLLSWQVSIRWITSLDSSARTAKGFPSRKAS